MRDFRLLFVMSTQVFFVAQQRVRRGGILLPCGVVVVIQSFHGSSPQIRLEHLGSGLVCGKGSHDRSFDQHAKSLPSDYYIKHSFQGQ